MKRARPDGLLSSLQDLPFVCPGCRGELEVLELGYRCPGACDREFRLHAGIPDFRIFPDPYLDFEADRERTDRVLGALDELPFPQLLERYWSWSEETPEPLRKRFVANALRGEQRALRLLALAQEEGIPDAASSSVLDIGSGTGNLLAAAAGSFRRVVGMDIAMRWLHLSRRRFKDRGLPEPALVCACAEAPPFPSDFFDAAFSIGTLEFARFFRFQIAQAARVVRNGGKLFVNTVNRFSAAPEPHVDLFGVGFLPRRWQPAYVRLLRKASFERIFLLSRGEIEKAAAGHFPSVSFRLPRLTRQELEGLPGSRRLAWKLYAASTRLPVIGTVLERLAPEWDIVMRKAG